MIKKSLSSLLAVTMFFSMAMPVYAEGSVTVTNATETVASVQTDDPCGADASASDGGTASIEVTGNIEVQNSDSLATGISSSADASGSEAKVSVGGSVGIQNFSTGTATGISISATDSAKAEALVSGGISTDAENGFTRGIEASVSGDNSEAKVSVGEGGIKTICEAEGSGAIGVYATSSLYGNGQVDIDVKGGVSATDCKEYSHTDGVVIDLYDQNKANVNIDKNIYSTGSSAYGVDVSVSDGASARVSVGGDITTDIYGSDGRADGIVLRTERGGSIDVRVVGDIKGRGLYSSVSTDIDSTATVNVFSEGTLSKGQVSAVTINSGSSPNLIIWKAELSGDGALIKEYAGRNYSSTDNTKELEKTIHYIIKVDPEQNIELSNTTAIDKYKTAKEGEKVAVKLNIPSGYDLVRAYCDKEKNTELVLGEDGYYLVVPKGGGIFVSMDLAPILKNNYDEPSIEQDPVDEVTNEVTIASDNYINGEKAVALSAGSFSVNRDGQLVATITGSNAFMLDQATINVLKIHRKKTITFVVGGKTVDVPLDEISELIKGAAKGVIFYLNGDYFEAYANGQLIYSVNLTGDSSKGSKKTGQVTSNLGSIGKQAFSKNMPGQQTIGNNDNPVKNQILALAKGKGNN